MKHLITLSLLAAVAIFTSCGGDDEPQPAGQKITFAANNAVSISRSTASSKSYDAKLSTANLVLTLDITNKILELDVNGLEIADGKLLTFKMECKSPTSYELSNDNSYTFASKNVNVSGLTTDVANVNAAVDSDGKHFNLVVSLSYDNTLYQVYFTDKNVLSSLSQGKDYASTTEEYYEYELDLSAMTADLYVHNISFVPGVMPVLEKICIPGVKIESPVLYSIILKADEVVPLYYMNGQPVEMPNRKVKDFSAILDFQKCTHNVQFNCFGLDWKASGNLHPTMK